MSQLERTRVSAVAAEVVAPGARGVHPHGAPLHTRARRRERAREPLERKERCFDRSARRVPPRFYDALEVWNASFGYPASDASLGASRSSLDGDGAAKPGARSCRVDPEAVWLQSSLLVRGACGCDEGVTSLMEGTIGLGGELSALLKPFTAAFDASRLFRTPTLRRKGCGSEDFASCLGLVSLDRCGDVASGTPPVSARRYSRGIPESPRPGGPPGSLLSNGRWIAPRSRAQPVRSVGRSVGRPP